MRAKLIESVFYYFILIRTFGSRLVPQNESLYNSKMSALERGIIIHERGL